MKKMLLWILPVLLLCGAPMNAMAVTEAGGTEVTINLEDLSSTTVTQVLKAKKKADEAKAAAEISSQTMVEAVKSTDPAELKAWLDIVGESLVGFCKTLGVGANEFIKTPVGLLIAGLAALNYGGMAIIDMIFSIVLSSMVWLISTSIIIWSYRRSHFKRVWTPFWPWSKADPIVIEPAIKESEKTGSMFIHCIIWLVISGVCALTAFSGW